MLLILTPPPHGTVHIGGGIGQKRETMNLLKDYIIYAIDTDPSPTQFRLLPARLHSRPLPPKIFGGENISTEFWRDILA